MESCMPETITRNLITLLICGVFGRRDEQVERLEPMSPHKWRKLVQTAEKLNVLPFVAVGADMLKDDANMSTTLMEVLSQRDDTEVVKFVPKNTELFNHWTTKRLNIIKDEELDSGNASYTTIEALDLIICNACEIIVRDVNVEAIVALGLFVQSNQKNIDFVKLGEWLALVGMVQMASLLGNILIDGLRMKPEEVPFAIKPYKKAKRLFHDSVAGAFDEKRSCGTATRLNVASLETLSHRFVSAISVVTDIEE